MAFYNVSPGNLIATDDPSAIIETCLGSCVGIAMYDPEAVIGGLVHIILPSGTEDKEKAFPARYARSGIPLLLDKLIKLGASKADIVAEIAGGGFMLNNSTFGGANYISIPPPIGAFDYYEGRNMQSLRPLSDREWNL